jgi:hypothetical protein
VNTVLIFLKTAHRFARKAGHLPLGTFGRGLSKLPGAEKI